jgi:hypothetical protein
MIPINDITTIESYLNGTLTADVLQQFKDKLQTDNDFVEQVFFQKMLQQTTQQFNQIAAFKQTLQKIKQARHQQTYTLEQLLGMFDTCNYYEKEYETEATIVRSKLQNNENIKVLQPLHHADLSEKVTFVFEPALTNAATISIENNKEEEVLTQHINTQTQNIELNIAHLPPGRYYWKLQLASKILLMDSFFIQKHLMP